MSMDYALAKELKDAGYKMPEHDFDFVMPQCHRCDYINESFCIPTLEELIEACGEDFYGLLKVLDVWYCAEPHHTDRPLLDTKGLTHTEAVARLWLALKTQ